MKNIIYTLLLFAFVNIQAQKTSINKSYVSVQGHVKERVDKFNKANQLRKRY